MMDKEPTAQSEHTAVKSERHVAHRGRKQWRGPAIFSAVLIIPTVAAVLSLGTTASHIREHLNLASILASQLKTQILEDNSEAANKTVDELKKQTGKARQASTEPLWTIASTLPWLGQNFQAVSTAATAADDVVRLAADPLASIADSLDWKELVPNSEGVQVKPLVVAQPKLVSAAHAVSQSAERLHRLDVNALLPQISEPIIKARGQLDSLRSELDIAADAAAIAPGMMGSSSPRQYLLVIQNNAETRATGGIPGALAVLNVEQGKLSLRSQTSATELGPMSPTITVDSEQLQIFSGRVGKFMQDINLTPDFPTSADVAIRMWQQKTGERLDGVVSIDPVALSYLLGATGPVVLSNSLLQDSGGGALPTILNQGNVVETLLSDVYAEIPEPGIQDLYFAGVAEEVFRALSSGKHDKAKLVEGVSRGVDEGRVLVWSATTAEQAVLAKYPLGGGVTSGSISPSQFGVYFNDGTGAKMDYYVKRTAQLIEECSNGEYGQVKVRITSTNTAPKNAATSLPEYVTGGGAFGVPPGTVQSNIVAYGPVQAHVEKALADGKKVSFNSQLHSGRPVGTVTVVLPPGKSSTVEFTFGKIVQHAEPKLAVTPTVQPLKDVVLGKKSETCVPAP